MEVRRARPVDAAAIAEVHVRTWQAAYEHVFGAERLAGIDPERRRLGWERALSERAEEEDVFVAEDDGRIVAFAGAGPSRDAPGEGELYSIYALPEAWGSGVGAALMAEALAALRARGFAESILWVLEDNPRARRFYKREGWRLDEGEWARKVEPYLGVDVAEVRYRITLAP
ncbi:MAG: N-acetyltransferase family protein [Gaiellaceae bacterium]